MLKEFLKEYERAVSPNIPLRMFTKTVESDLNLVSYRVNMVNINPANVARIAKQLIESEFTQNQFDLVIDLLVDQKQALFQFYLRVDGKSHSGYIQNGNFRFKVRGVLVAGKLVITGGNLHKPNIATRWKSNWPARYFVIELPPPPGDQPELLIPETVLRFLAVRERIDIDTIKRVCVDGNKHYYLSPTKDHHSSLYLLTTLSKDSAIYEELYQSGYCSIEARQFYIQPTGKNNTLRIEMDYLIVNEPEEHLPVVLYPLLQRFN